MKVNINFKFFSQNVSVGYCLILLGMTIECVYAAVIRPDARWLLILLTFFVDLFCVFDIGRICRSYDIRTDGVVAIWFGIFRRFYPWSSFCSVSWERVNLGCRVVTGVLCTQIPLKRQRSAYGAWGNYSVHGADGKKTTDATFIGHVNPLRYRGYYYDRETRLYYLQSRYYDFANCRFINADGQFTDGFIRSNLFAYCENNPIRYSDPTGLLPDCLC